MCYFREWGQLYNITESDTIPVQFKMLSCLHLDGSSLDVLWVFPWRYIHWFSFLVEISFHLSFCISYFLRANNIHCLYFFIIYVGLMFLRVGLVLVERQIVATHTCILCAVIFFCSCLCLMHVSMYLFGVL